MGFYEFNDSKEDGEGAQPDEPVGGGMFFWGGGLRGFCFGAGRVLGVDAGRWGVGGLAEVVVADLATGKLEGALALTDFLAPGAAGDEGCFVVVIVGKVESAFFRIRVIATGKVGQVRIGDHWEFGQRILKKGPDGMVRNSPLKAAVVVGVPKSFVEV